MYVVMGIYNQYALYINTIFNYYAYSIARIFYLIDILCIYYRRRLQFVHGPRFADRRLQFVHGPGFADRGFLVWGSIKEVVYPQNSEYSKLFLYAPEPRAIPSISNAPRYTLHDTRYTTLLL